MKETVDRRVGLGRIAADFDVSRPAISQHLKVLLDAGLVHERREGRRRIYALDPTPLAEVSEWLETYRASWERNLLSLKEYVEAEATAGSASSPKASPPRRRRRDRGRRG